MNKLTALIKKLTVLVSYLPTWNTVTCITALSYWNAPNWMCITFGIILLINWGACLYEYYLNEIAE